MKDLIRSLGAYDPIDKLFLVRLIDWSALFVDFSCNFLKLRGCALYKGASYSAKITVKVKWELTRVR
jgi:hypothetical protein